MDVTPRGRRRSLPAGWGRAVAAVARRPRLWRAGLRQARRLAPTGWWRRPPYLPLPAPEWVAFRLETMYGDADHPIEPGDVVAWLRWSARQR
ncbi:MAG: hypothetical protein HYX34_01250 [Actinobacteria bacterium]|nr:hypothetical protein [Actinomycetota bacterium]